MGGGEVVTRLLSCEPRYVRSRRLSRDGGLRHGRWSLLGGPKPLQTVVKRSSEIR